jgi:hypothetical protein
MSYEEVLKTISVEASADLSAHQYKFMNVDSSGQLELVTTLGGEFLGILQDKPAAVGRAGSVGIDGVTKIEASAAIAAGAIVVSTTAGLAVTASADGQIVLGIAMEAATATGDIIAVTIDKHKRYVAP